MRWAVRSNNRLGFHHVHGDLDETLNPGSRHDEGYGDTVRLMLFMIRIYIRFAETY